MINDTTALQHLIYGLKSADQMPRNIELARVGHRYWCSAYDGSDSAWISESAFTGMASTKEVAVLKSLSERAERIAAREGVTKGVSACMTERTDGFAAFPKIYGKPACARDAALAEATERFVWATWWDDLDISHENLSNFDTRLSFESRMTVLFYKSEISAHSFHVISPRISGLSDKIVVIIFAELNDGGFVSGGACGDRDSFELTFMRGMDELYRHGIALSRMKKFEAATSFYERRLAYFGFGQGAALVHDRLSRAGQKCVHLPSLAIDALICHRFEDFFDVHRCYFENQPPFVGGALERLCL